MNRFYYNKNYFSGWLFGVTETGEGGVFPCESVVPLNKQEILRISRKMVSKIDEIKNLINKFENFDCFALFIG